MKSTTTTTTAVAFGKAKIANKKSRQIQDYNELFTCNLCDGYMIDPTAVDQCGHTFCRSCILKHLLKSAYCPECGTAGKTINANNLGSDKILRSLIYKLVPGLYQSEKGRHIEFYLSKKNDDEDTKLEPDDFLTTEQDEFFIATEPISLSLEYHPALLEDCQEEEIPPVRYLQCPASVQIQHLKRFLYSKFALDPHNGKIVIEIIYEEEILPDNFMLMDVGYCYNWKREAPMRFMYRILVYSEPPIAIANCRQSQATHEDELFERKSTSIGQKPRKSVSFVNETMNFEPGSTITKVASVAIAVAASDDDAISNEVAPMKVVITRKPTDSKSKLSGKRSHNGEEPVAPINDFKSLRSNDIRFSDYTVTPASTAATATSLGKQNVKTTATATTVKSQTSSNMRFSTTKTTQSAITKSASSSLSSASSSPSMAATAAAATTNSLSQPQPSVVPIVVSIPQSQVAKTSPYAFDESSDNLSLAQLKTACKKSPNTIASNASTVKNVPKLKIELSTMKTKLTIPKPKSAEAIIDSGRDHHGPSASKKAKYRKHSLDIESGPITGKVDLETYAKNIGLKPIEVVAPTLDTLEAGDKAFKYSPNASPMSSCSSSTTSSSNGGNGHFSSNNIDSHSGHSSHSSHSGHSGHSHKKHKKKHSKESREPKEGKRRKLHAEISSKPADESLKMKVKITTASTTHSHKTHRSKATPPSTPAAAPISPKPMETQPKSPPKSPSTASQSSSAVKANSIPTTPSTAAPPSITPPPPPTQPTPPPPAVSPKGKPSPKPDTNNTLNMVALNKTLGEEVQSIKKLMCEKPETVSKVLSAPPSASIRQPHLLPKPVLSLKESQQKLPTSPPLPPSLFKTMPLTFTTLPTSSLTFTTLPSSSLRPSPPTNTSDSLKLSQPKQQHATSQSQSKSQPFAVPNPPRPKHFSAPSSIASSIYKQAAANYLQLKRSASLDDAKSSPLSKQQRLDQDRLLRKTAYGPTVSSLPASAAKLIQQQFQSKDDKNRTSVDSGIVEMPPFYAPLITPFGALTQRTSANSTTGVSSPPLNITRLNDAILKSSGLLPQSNQPAAAGPSISFNTRSPASVTPAQLNLIAATAAPLQQLPLLNKAPMEVTNLPTPSQTDAVPLALPVVNSGKPSTSNRLMGPPISSPNKIKKPAPLSPSTLAAVKKANFGSKAAVVLSPPLTTTTSNTNLTMSSNFSSTTSLAGQKGTPNSISISNINKKSQFRSSPPAVVNFRTTVPLRPPTAKPTLASASQDTNAKQTSKSIMAAAAAVTIVDHAKSNGVTEKIKPTAASLREFRPVSKDNSVEILDLSGGSKPSAKESIPRASKSPPSSAAVKTPTTTAPTSNSHGNSLEAALNKMKQSITTCTVTNADAAAAAAAASAKSSNTERSGDDLQNLHLLSESATAREKIAIKSQSLAVTTATSTNVASPHQSIYEKQATLVRQQNASVRNIPNPSALAFRNQQITLPTTSMENTTTSAVNTTTINTTTSSSPHPSKTTTAPSILSNKVSTATTLAATTASPSTTDTVPPTSSNTSTAHSLQKIDQKSTASTTNSTSTSPQNQNRSTKKLTTIDQVAATLNIRAAAAEASAARAATAAAVQEDNNIAVGSPSNNTTTNAGVPGNATDSSTAAAKSANKNENSSIDANSSTVEANKSNGAASTSTPKPIANCDTSKPTVTPSSVAAVAAAAAAATTSSCNNTAETAIVNNNNDDDDTNRNNNKHDNSDINTNTSTNNNNSNNNNINNIKNNNNSNSSSSSKTNSNNNNGINNLKPASTSALPLPTLLSSSSAASSSSLLSESNQTSLVAQGSI